MNKKIIQSILILITVFLPLQSQNQSNITILKPVGTVHPLERVIVNLPSEGIVSVKDGKGREYFNSKTGVSCDFIAGGAAGRQTIELFDKNGKSLAVGSFILESNTVVDDGGKFTELFKMLYRGMTESGEAGEIIRNGKSYKFYVSWDLDNSNVMNGMQYFQPYGYGLTDLLRETQRADGMIWSFVRWDKSDYNYYYTAYDPIGFYRNYGDIWFARQPVDNHSDYCYVNMFYKQWKAGGDVEWMKKTLPSAALALDYCYTDSIRWSKHFQLLKRPYCIDSWDFQVDDEYTPQADISPTMVVVPGKTKYGIFFGDNTGYFEACNQLAEMYEFIGEKGKADVYRKRGEEIMTNLEKLSWNGEFFTHFIDEDPSVKRNLGVDEKSQIAQSNMYSLNRGLPHEMNVAIIRTYQDLKQNLPEGSPGEWYSIYPPFERGFESHGAKWQYMNGGIAGHGIGELARGAYENGFEDYGSDILYRLLELGRKYNNKIYFSYTGSIPEAPPVPKFKPLDISEIATMDLCDIGGKKSIPWMNDRGNGNDMKGLPLGNQKFNGIDFRIAVPSKNNRNSAIALSVNQPFPKQAEIPVNDYAGSVYLLHTISGMGSAAVAGAISFEYEDGSKISKYIYNNKDVTNWWFPALNTKRSGVAWTGPNKKSTSVGVCWAAIDNPNPSKKIARLRFDAPLEGGVYAILGVSLADRPLYIKPSGESFGGPDNWASANGMAAIMEGLAGLKNETQAYETVKISPRWVSAGVDSVNVTSTLSASGGYVSYKFKNDRSNSEISILLTGSGNHANLHVLLPRNLKNVESLIVDNLPVSFNLTKVEDSQYIDFELTANIVHLIKIKYKV